MSARELDELIAELDANRTNIGCCLWSADHPREDRVSVDANPAAALVRLERENPRAAAARRAMRGRCAHGRADLKHR